MPEYVLQTGEEPAPYLGMKETAANVGVTLPRLVAWLRDKRWIVRDAVRGNWQPCLSLGVGAGEIRYSKRFKSWSILWSPEMVRRIKEHADEIAGHPLPQRAPSTPKPPTPRQKEMIERLSEDLGVEVAAMPVTKKLATDLIEEMLGKKRAQNKEAKRVAPATVKQVEYVKQLAEEIGSPEEQIDFDDLTMHSAGELIEEMLYERDSFSPKM